VSKKPGVLIIRTRMIGDVLLDTPLIRALRRKGFEVHYLTGRVASEILARNPHVSRLFRREDYRFVELLKTVRINRYYALFDFMHNLWSMALTAFSGADIRAAITEGDAVFPYNFKVKPPYEAKPYTVFHRLEFLRTLGIDPEGFSADLEFPIPEGVLKIMEERLREAGWRKGEFLVAVHADPGSPVRNWPLDRFLSVSERLVKEFDARVLFIWTPDKKGMLETALAAVKTEKVSLAPPTETLHHLGALLRLVDLFFGVDSGPRHIAISQGTPTFAIFTHASPAGWTPPGDPRHGHVSKGLPCQPCGKPRCPLGTYECLKTLSVEEVYGSLREFIKRVWER